MLNGMELRHLRYFVAVAEEENVTRAAERLHISQPSLSRQIRDLEEELGVELFTRTAKSLSLTPAGRTFLAEAHSILLKVDVAITVTRDSARGTTGQIDIGYAPSPTAELLPRLLQRFRKEVPGTEVKVHELSSAEMIRGLRTRSIDAALIVENRKATYHGFTFDPLLRDPAGLLVPAGHPLAKRRRFRPEDLLSLPLAVYTRAEYLDYHDWLRAIFGSSFRKLRVVEECDGALSLIAAVDARQIFAVSAASIRALAGRRAVFVQLVPAPPICVGIRYPSNLPPGSPVRAFVAAAKAAAATIVPPRARRPCP